MKKIGTDTRSGVAYSGFDSLAEGTARQQQSLQFESQSAATRNQMAQTTIQSLSNASQNIAQAKINTSQALEAADQRTIAAKAQPGGGSLGQIAQALSGAASTYMQVQSKNKELDAAEHDIVLKQQQAQYKQEQQANYDKAASELEDYMLSNMKDGMLASDVGSSQFKNGGLDILGKYDIDPEARKELAGKLYTKAEGIVEKQLTAKKDYMDKLKSSGNELILQEIQTKAAASISDMGSMNENTRDNGLKSLQAIISDTLDRDDLDQVDKNFIISGSLKYGMEHYQGGSDGQAALQEKYNSVQQYMWEQNQSDEKVRTGEWDTTQRNAYLQKKRYDLHLGNGDVIDTDPFQSDKDAQERGKRDADLKAISESHAIDAVKKQELTNDDIGNMVIQMLADPSLVEKWKADPVMSQHPGVKTALAQREIYLQVQKDNLELNFKRSGILNQLNQKNESDYKWLINQGKKKADPTAAAILLSLQASAKIDFSQLPAEESGATQEQIAEVQRLAQQYRTDLTQQAQLIQTQMTNNIAQLRPYRLDADEGTLKKVLPERLKSATDRINALAKVAADSVQQEERVGIASPSRAGGRPAFGGVKSLAHVKTPKGNIIFPFKAGTPVSGANDINWKEGRGDHLHAGEDLGIALGTPLIAYVGGVVTQVRFQDGTRADPGYGQYVTIKGDDGKYHRFAHLTKGSVQFTEGQRVEAGQFFAKSGNTGNGVTHLHWEVRNDDKFGDRGSVNPYEYMASQMTKTSVMSKPVGKDPGVEFKPGRPNPRIPEGALLLGSGQYWYKGQMKSIEMPSYVAEPEQKFNTAKPLSTGLMSNNAKSYGKSEPGKNYHYAALAKDPSFANELANVANRLGIPAVWLADVIDYETMGTWRTGIVNRLGATGLIQFMPRTAQGLGTSTAALAKMTPTQQLKYVEKYLQPVKQHINKGIDYLYMAINGGSGNLAEYVKGANKANMSDGNKTFKEHMNIIGSGAGRKYETKFTRRDRLTTATHTSFHSDCKVCNQMKRSSDKVTPHKAQ